MSPLSIIKRSTQRKERLTHAQFLMAKAYRGIPYAGKAEGFDPQSRGRVKTYRGIEYAS